MYILFHINGIQICFRSDPNDFFLSCKGTVKMPSLLRPRTLCCRISVSLCICACVYVRKYAGMYVHSSVLHAGARQVLVPSGTTALFLSLPMFTNKKF